VTYLVTDNCVKCKHTDCVAVCPVDCFYEADNFLAINPDECIDCGVCEPECPVDAIVSEVAISSEEREKWDAIFNKKQSDYKELQQDLTELNGDGNRTRGRYGEDNDKSNSSV